MCESAKTRFESLLIDVLKCDILPAISSWLENEKQINVSIEELYSILHKQRKRNTRTINKKSSNSDRNVMDGIFKDMRKDDLTEQTQVVPYKWRKDGKHVLYRTIENNFIVGELEDDRLATFGVVNDRVERELNEEDRRKAIEMRIEIMTREDFVLKYDLDNLIDGDPFHK